jgi:hypothetical protein
MEFTGYPDLKRRDVPREGEGGTTRRPTTGEGWSGGRRRGDVVVRRAALRHQPDRLQGQHDHARRRDPPRAEPAEGGVFNTEAKHSVRLNQLGYSALEGLTRT